MVHQFRGLVLLEDRDSFLEPMLDSSQLFVILALEIACTFLVPGGICIHLVCIHTLSHTNSYTKIINKYLKI